MLRVNLYQSDGLPTLVGLPRPKNGPYWLAMCMKTVAKLIIAFKLEIIVGLSKLIKAAVPKSS